MEPFIIIALSFLGLHWGAGLLIISSEKLAYRIKLPVWFISGLLLSIGTSLPEAVVSITSSLEGYQQLAVGNIIGSNMANIGLALAFPWALFSYQNVTIPRLYIVKFLAIQVFFVSVLIFYEFNVMVGIVMIVLFILSLLNKFPKTKQTTIKVKYRLTDVLHFLMALALVPVSSHFIVRSAGEIMHIYGISELFFGIVVVAIGTSIPEIYTTFFAFRQKKYNVAIMNIIGSNIINSSIVTAIICFLGGYRMEAHREVYDLLFMLFLSALLSCILILKKENRLLGVLLIGFYAGYLISWF